ncbi:MAG: NAD-dependent epimerase/dehydratase family protein, partial [Fibromonadaceae bacterium]|nr:NAD-dependent epimerase/dehydratase family protein [Fibromonadaceae bacterium]
MKDIRHRKLFDSAIVIGSGGFVGAHLCRVLAERGIETHKADIASATPIDIRKPFDLNGNFGAGTAIFNLAAIHRTPGHPDREYFETNMP